jgi:hypothetical protein
LTDLGSGLNLYRVKDLKDLDYLSFGDSLTFNYELLLEMIDSDKEFEFFPIQWREVDQVSNARNFKIFKQGLTILFQNKFQKGYSDVYPDRVYEVDRKK